MKANEKDEVILSGLVGPMYYPSVQLRGDPARKVIKMDEITEENKEPGELFPAPHPTGDDLVDRVIVDAISGATKHFAGFLLNEQRKTGLPWVWCLVTREATNSFALAWPGDEHKFAARLRGGARFIAFIAACECGALMLAKEPSVGPAESTLTRRANREFYVRFGHRKTGGAE
jgi:hypothetical protein